jgi:Flp pilus assembly pilin Flp
MTTFMRLLRDERGTAFVEYSSLALLIAIAAIAVLGQANGHFIN